MLSPLRASLTLSYKAAALSELPVKQNFVSFFEKWIKFKIDDLDSSSLMIEFLQFVDELKCGKATKGLESELSWGKNLDGEFSAAVTLQNILSKNTIYNLDTGFVPESMPRPILGKSATSMLKQLGKRKTKFDITNIDAVEFARQWSLRDRRLFNTLDVGQICAVKHTTDLKAIQSMADTFNTTAHWVAKTVMSAPSSKKRASIITRFIMIADALLNLRNYQGFVCCVSGLSLTSVSRLKRSWRYVDKSTMESFKRFQDIACDYNYTHIRKQAADTSTPFVPLPSKFASHLLALTHSIVFARFGALECDRRMVAKWNVQR